ncbi:MAG: N-acetylmuramoyl-L-alanine amidase [Bacteroidales bacterium]|nr:N-acetylmuramoyl-L-alanine amidase [Candidatus Colicola coprequi]
MKISYKSIVLALLFVFVSSSLMASQFVVVIDAGHGGKDAGAVGRTKLMEKDLNLDVSRRVASMIRDSFPEDVKVVMTRDKDIFIPLQERANIVNRNNANLFICIHTNAAESRSACGAETFILGTERMEDNLDVAMRENAVMKLESDYQTTYQGFDPNSIDSYIMFELMQNQYMDQSLNFASLVQTQLISELKREDRGVRQAAFWVLLKSACPSVLVEMGFISNADEERYLASEQGREEISQAIYSAFESYYSQVIGKKRTITVKQSTETSQNEVEPIRNKTQETTDRTPVKNPKKQETLWAVQIFSSKTIVPEGDYTFRGLKGCRYTKTGIWYKYTYGSCATREEADALRKELDKKFPDCFVVKITQ